MPGRRRVLGLIVGIARVIGLMLIVLAILSLPQIRFPAGHFKEGVGTLSSAALAVVGVLWLIAVELFLRFFDQFLSRN